MITQTDEERAAIRAANAEYRRGQAERRKGARQRDSLIRAQARANIPLQTIAERHGLLLHPVQCIIKRHRGYATTSKPKTL